MIRQLVHFIVIVVALSIFGCATTENNKPPTIEPTPKPLPRTGLPLRPVTKHLSAPIVGSPSRYHLISLPPQITAGVPDESCIAINDGNEIAGVINAADNSGALQPVIWRIGSPKPVRAGATDREVEINAINNKGDIVGWSGEQWSGTVSFLSFKACLWNKQGTRLLNTKTFQMHSAAPTNPMLEQVELSANQAYAVNIYGDVVGYNIPESAMEGSDEVGGITRAVVWLRSGAVVLGRGSALGINDCGEVVGRTPEGATLWRGKERITIVAGAACDINNRSQIVGYTGAKFYLGESRQKAFEWQQGRMQYLETIAGRNSSAALAINDRGQIVGTTTDAAKNDPVACLWQNGKGYDLNQLLSENERKKWRLLRGTGINNQGYIVGIGISQGTEKPFLLAPSIPH